MKRLFCVLVLLAVPASAQFGKHRANSHATDCTSITAKANEFCYELDSNTWWVCEPSAGKCDTAGEWFKTEENDLEADDPPNVADTEV